MAIRSYKHRLPILSLTLILLTACSGPSTDDPARTDRLDSAWTQFHAYIVDKHPEIDFKLNPGADAAQIEAAEKVIGRKLSPELRALYSLANGQDGEGFSLFPGYRFLPLDEIGPQVELMNGWGLFFIRFIPADPDPGVKGWWWDKDWLPIGENGAGDLFCVDFAPASGGTSGQLISFVHDMSPRRRFAAGLTEYFEEMPAGIESGTWVPYLEWQVFLSRAEAEEYGFLENKAVENEKAPPDDAEDAVSTDGESGDGPDGQEP